MRAFGAGAKGKKVCETANFIVKYTKKDSLSLVLPTRQNALERKKGSHDA